MNMLVEQTTDLGADALENPQKYNGFMGISILHRFFSKKTMSFYFDWCSVQFKETVILLMDDPDKYNFTIFKKIPEDESLHKARLISDEIKRGYERILAQKNIQNIKILQFREFISQPRYINILSSIHSFLKENNQFHSDLYNLMDHSIGNKIQEFVQLNNIPTSNLSSIKETLFQYIVEEVASIVYLTEIGYPIELDPTIEFSTKKLIYEGHFPELFNKLQLSRRGHIFLHPEGIVKSSY